MFPLIYLLLNATLYYSENFLIIAVNRRRMYQVPRVFLLDNTRSIPCYPPLHQLSMALPPEHAPTELSSEFTFRLRIATRSDRIRHATFSPSGDMLACGSEEGFVNVYDTQTGDLRHSHTIERRPEISALVWHTGIHSLYKPSSKHPVGLIIGTSQGTVHTVCSVNNPRSVVLTNLRH